MSEKSEHELLSENYVLSRESEREKEQALHEKKMQSDLEYRRNYYKEKLNLKYRMIPEENYYRAEYEKIVEIYHAYDEKFDQIEKNEDFLALLEEFDKKTKKVWNSKIVGYGLGALCLIVVIVFIILVINS